MFFDTDVSTNGKNARHHRLADAPSEQGAPEPPLSRAPHPLSPGSSIRTRALTRPATLPALVVRPRNPPCRLAQTCPNPVGIGTSVAAAVSALPLATRAAKSEPADPAAVPTEPAAIASPSRGGPPAQTPPPRLTGTRGRIQGAPTASVRPGVAQDTAGSRARLLGQPRSGP